MDETKLINRIFELYTEADRTFEKYVLYGGLIDSELNILQAKEMKPENMQPKEAFTNLMYAYKNAIALKEACKIYYSFNLPPARNEKRTEAPPSADAQILSASPRRKTSLNRPNENGNQIFC